MVVEVVGWGQGWGKRALYSIRRPCHQTLDPLNSAHPQKSWNFEIQLLTFVWVSTWSGVALFFPSTEDVVENLAANRAWYILQGSMGLSREVTGIMYVIVNSFKYFWNSSARIYRSSIRKSLSNWFRGSHWTSTLTLRIHLQYREGNTGALKGDTRPSCIATSILW